MSPRGLFRGLFLSACVAFAPPSAVSSTGLASPHTDVRVELGGRLERDPADGSLWVVTGDTRWEVDVSGSAALAADAGRLQGARVAIVGGFAERAAPSRPVPIVRATELRRGERASANVRIRLQGPLRAGVMAIGAETTGVTVRAGGRDWELQLQPRHLDAVDGWNGRTVEVEGRLELRRGVELRTRRIVHVRRIAPRPAQP